MNIAILLLNKGRGSGEVARSHAHHLLNLGHKVYFVQPNIGDGVPGAINVDVKLSTDIIPVHENLPSAGDKQKQVALMDADEMSKYLVGYEEALNSIANDVDIFIGHHANLTSVATHNVAKKHKKPYLLFLHGTSIEPRHEGLWDDENWGLIENAIKEANGIIVTTDYVRDELVKPLIPLEDSCFLVLPVGVNLKDFNPENTFGIREKYNLPERYVITPGALIESKGPQNVVEASSEYREQASTVFIGEGELKNELEKELGDKGMFLGFVSQEDKAKLINTATLLVAAPEKKEHFGIIYTEALAGGTPVVAYGGGGVNSIITPAEGILTERSPKILGEEVNKLLKNEDLISQMGKSARARAEENYDSNELVKKLSDWLGDII